MNMNNIYECVAPPKRSAQADAAFGILSNHTILPNGDGDFMGRQRQRPEAPIAMRRAEAPKLRSSEAPKLRSPEAPRIGPWDVPCFASQLGL